MQKKPVLDISKPEDARRYCDGWSTGSKKIAEVTLEVSPGRLERIVFSNMTDEQAVRAAHSLYDLEIEAAMHQMQRAREMGLVQ